MKTGGVVDVPSRTSHGHERELRTELLSVYVSRAGVFIFLYRLAGLHVSCLSGLILCVSDWGYSWMNDNN